MLNIFLFFLKCVFNNWSSSLWIFLTFWKWWKKVLRSLLLTSSLIILIMRSFSCSGWSRSIFPYKNPFFMMFSRSSLTWFREFICISFIWLKSCSIFSFFLIFLFQSVFYLSIYRFSSFIFVLICFCFSTFGFTWIICIYFICFFILLIYFL